MTVTDLGPPDPSSVAADLPPPGATSDAPPAAPPARQHRLRRAIFFRPTFGGLAGALLFWLLSLTPTLLPRAWTMQAAVSAICAAIGYLVGTWIGRGVHAVLHLRGRQPGKAATRRAWIVLGIVAAVLAIAALIAWVISQNDQRDLVTLEHISAIVIPPMLIVTVLLGAVLVIIGRLVGHGIASLERLLDRFVPKALAVFLTFALGAAIFSVVVNEVVIDSFFGWANRTFGSLDNDTPPGVVQPASPLRSGSPASLVPWDTLGAEGRNFAGSAPTVEQLRAFAGPDADVKEPIRVYTGLKSAGSPQERAALAVQELERTGAFDREVLAVVTVTGTGWVDPAAARALEFLHGGDTAMVAQQYSYLPSWISFLVDADKAAEAATALNDAVHQRWSELPEDARPQLIVFGLSLGSYGAEAAFAGPDVAASIANMVDRSDGVLLVGPTDANPVWRQLQAAREPGSPVWRPVFDGGKTVRFANGASDLAGADASWTEPRVLYLHHPSDPVGSVNTASIWQRPAWTRPPTGYDVPDRIFWFPAVTFVQEVADLVAGFSTPPGFGHDYTTDYVAGWAAVAPPAGWSDADSTRLQQYLGAG